MNIHKAIVSPNRLPEVRDHMVAQEDNLASNMASRSPLRNKKHDVFRRALEKIQNPAMEDKSNNNINVNVHQSSVETLRKSIPSRVGNNNDKENGMARGSSTTNCKDKVQAIAGIAHQASAKACHNKKHAISVLHSEPAHRVAAAKAYQKTKHASLSGIVSRTAAANAPNHAAPLLHFNKNDNGTAMHGHGARSIPHRPSFFSPDGQPRAAAGMMRPSFPAEGSSPNVTNDDVNEASSPESIHQSQQEQEDNLVTTLPVALVHARLDPSLECCVCQASHDFYLMYPVIKTLDTWNESSKFLCSQCYHDKSEEEPIMENDDDKSSDEENDERFLIRAWPTRLDSLANKKKRAILRPVPKAPRPETISLIRDTSCDVQACLDLLQAVEDEMEIAAISLSEEHRTKLTAEIRRELLPRNTNDADTLQQVGQQTKDEVALHDEQWQQHWDLLQDTAMVLQAALESEGDKKCDLLLAYYQWRAGHHSPEEASKDRRPPAWKLRADAALDKRDSDLGLGPGTFWGASGWHPSRASQELADNDRDGDPYRNHYIEKLATLRESQYFQLCVPYRRGLGWNAVTAMPAGQQATLDESRHSAEEAALKEEAGIYCIPRTEREDRDLMIQEYKSEPRTVLVRVLAPKSRPPLISLGPAAPTNEQELAAKRQRLEQPPAPTPLKSKSRDGGGDDDIVDDNSSASSECFDEDSSVHSSSSRANKTSSCFPSPPRTKRAKRRCKRCIKFNGQSPTRCRGSKGRWGQKGCEYFAASGKKLKW